MNEHIHLESLYPSNSRFEEIEQILTYIKRGESCEMIGFPGVGRGNLCKFLTYNTGVRIQHLGKDHTSYHFVYVDFAEVKERTLFEVMKFLFLQLAASLHERQFIYPDAEHSHHEDKTLKQTKKLFKDSYAEIDRMFKKYVAYHDDLILFEGLKEAVDFLAHEKNLQIVLLLERFETYIPRLSETFFINLRSLRDKAKYKFSVVFSLNRPLEDTVEQAVLADFYEFFAGRQIFLGLCDKPGILFRICYLEEISGQKLNDKTKKALFRLTAGHGKLTRLGTEALLATHALSSPDGGKIRQSETSDSSEVDTLDTFLLSHKTILQACREIWDFLTPGEQADLLSKNEESFQKQKKDPLAPQGVIQDDKKGLLEKISLLENNQITIPIFAAWISLFAKLLDDEQDQIFYDPDTNTIKRGAANLSDTLTAAEYKLLKFLLEHPHAVLERETIIAAVWKDTATTLGVTDQALDQLIFRLRKKIELDPNNPHHIQTIKGRGIKYEP